MPSVKIGEILLDGQKGGIIQTIFDMGEGSTYFYFTRKRDGRVAMEVYGDDWPEAVVERLEGKQ